MRRHLIPKLTKFLCLSIAAMTSVVAFAQHSTKSITADGGALRLLIREGAPLFHAQNESVQKELGVDEETRRKLNELLLSFGKESDQIQAEQAKLSGLPEGERRVKSDELGKRRGPLELETSKQFYSLLTEEQIVRFHGTFLQARGAEALLRTDVKRWLGLSENQSKQLADFELAYRRGKEELYKMKLSDSQENGRRLRGLREDRERKALEVLTDEQREKLAKAKGAPFEFQPVPPLKQ